MNVNDVKQGQHQDRCLIHVNSHSSISFIFYIFNWRIITLQCCVGFCCTVCKSAISIYISPPSRTSLPPSQPSISFHFFCSSIPILNISRNQRSTTEILRHVKRLSEENSYTGEKVVESSNHFTGTNICPKQAFLIRMTAPFIQEAKCNIYRGKEGSEVSEI